MRLSLILPTYNEAKNLPELLKRVAGSLTPHEVIVVDDDSPDGTWKVAEDLQKTYSWLRVLRRVGRKGLSSAVVEGCDLATGDILLVMDSDMQHDPSLINAVAQKIADGAVISVASRYRPGGSVGEWVHGRRWLSKFGTWIAQKLPNVETTDPMSGFFAVQADAYKKARPFLKPEGFKILFELLAALPRGTTIAEVSLQFQPRLHGESKLSLLVQLQFLKQALRIGLRRIGITSARVFIVLSVILAVIFALRIWAIRPIFLDVDFRTALPARLQTFADDRGWLLSDVWVESISENGFVTLKHRRHMRGEDPEECLLLRPSVALTLCDD